MSSPMRRWVLVNIPLIPSRFPSPRVRSAALAAASPVSSFQVLRWRDAPDRQKALSAPIFIGAARLFPRPVRGELYPTGPPSGQPKRVYSEGVAAVSTIPILEQDRDKFPHALAEAGLDGRAVGKPPHVLGEPRGVLHGAGPDHLLDLGQAGGPHAEGADPEAKEEHGVERLPGDLPADGDLDPLGAGGLDHARDEAEHARV